MQIGQLEYALDDSILTQRVLYMRIGAEDVCAFADKAALKLRRRMQIQGFRLNRAPLTIVRKHYWPRLREQVFEELRRAATQQVLKLLDERDQPFLPPEVLYDPETLPGTDAERESALPADLHSSLDTARAFPRSPQINVPDPGRHPAKRLRYGEDFEFSVKYLIDPAGISRHPETAGVSAQQGGQAGQYPGQTAGAMGIPTGPALPSIPGLPGMPSLPGMSTLPPHVAAIADKSLDGGGAAEQ